MEEFNAIKRLAGLNESLVLENDIERDAAFMGEMQRTVFSIVKQMSNEDKKKHPEYQKVFQNELKKIQDESKRQNKPSNPQAEQQAAEKKALKKIHFKIEAQIRDIVAPSLRAKYYGK